MSSEICAFGDSAGPIPGDLQFWPRMNRARQVFEPLCDCDKSYTSIDLHASR